MSEAKNTQVITAEDLLKSIKDVAGVKDETTTTEVVTEVKVAADLKKTADALATGSEPMKKALEVSSVLHEVVELIGNHVDASLEAMNKSIQQAGERDNQIVGALVALKKSIDANTEAVKTYGEKAAAATTALPAGTKVVVLAKNADGSGKDTEINLDPVQLKKQVMLGAEKLMKSMKRDDPGLGSLTRNVSLFQAGGKVPEDFIRECLKAQGVETKATAAAA